MAIGLYALICVIHAVRARIEGIAAARKRSDAVMCGQIAYTVALLVACSVLLPLGVPGWLMAVLAIHAGPIAVTATVYGRLRKTCFCYN